jgi:hypothetical protein
MKKKREKKKSIKAEKKTHKEMISVYTIRASDWARRQMMD